MIPLLSSIPFLVHFSLSVLAAIRLLYRKLAVNTTLAWLFLLFGLPVVGVVLYVLFGDHRLSGRRMKMGERLRSFFMQVFDITAPASRRTLRASPVTPPFPGPSRPIPVSRS
jgi:cardiolipin synthase